VFRVKKGVCVWGGGGVGFVINFLDLPFLFRR
jgi:hypothetical protein